MESEPSELRRALVEAYPIYVVGVLESRGFEVTTLVADAVVEGAAVLDGLLMSLERLDPIDQRHSPLELFREALRPVSHALEVAGVRTKDAALLGGAPWDRYGLAPGSSQVLGRRAHEAHLRWGVEKSAALAPLVNRPLATVVASSDRGDDLTDILLGLGYRTTPSEGGRPTLVLVDIAGTGAHDAIHRAAEAGAEVVAFGDDLDDLATPGLRALGASTVVRTSDLLRDPERYLPIVT